METINDRMEKLINERFNGNKAAFAKTIGLPPTGLSNYLGNKRRSKPSVDMVTKIILSLNVDARWLLTGEGCDKPGNVSVGDNTEGNVAIGSNNTAGNVIISNAGDTAVWQERVSMLEKLLDEKERLIKFLIEHKQ